MTLLTSKSNPLGIIVHALTFSAFSFSEVFFIDATSIDTLSADLSLITKAKGRGTDAQSALRWLAAERTRWLMIFDNADDPALNLHDYFPPCVHGNILITTRNYDMIRHATPGHESCFRVSDMQPEDSVELLLKAANVPLSDLDSQVHATQLAQVCLLFSLHVLNNVCSSCFRNSVTLRLLSFKLVLT